MYARVKPEHKHGTVTAFGGREYTKRGWLFVPAANEAEALRHPYLLTIAEMEDAPLEVGAVSIVAPEVIAEPAAPQPVADVQPATVVIEAPSIESEVAKRGFERANRKKGGR